MALRSEGLGYGEDGGAAAVEGADAGVGLGAIDPAQGEADAGVCGGDADAVVVVVQAVVVVEDAPSVMAGQAEVVGQRDCDGQVVVPGRAEAIEVVAIVHNDLGCEVGQVVAQGQVILVGVVGLGVGHWVLVAEVPQVHAQLVEGLGPTQLEVQLHAGTVVSWGGQAHELRAGGIILGGHYGGTGARYHVVSGPRGTVDVGCPYPGVEADRGVAVIEAALDGRAVSGLADAAEHIVRRQGHVGGEGVGRLALCASEIGGAHGGDQEGASGAGGAEVSAVHGRLPVYGAGLTALLWFRRPVGRWLRGVLARGVKQDACHARRL